MMTREEAIELKAAVGRLMYSNNKDVRDYNALVDFIESAFRPVSREQVEMVWRGEWIDAYPGTSSCKCTKCGAVQGYESTFCCHCGAPMTDEAVEMVLERMEALKDGSTTD